MNLKKVSEISKEKAKELLNAGKEAKKYTFPIPGEGYSVAVLTDKENIYTGASYKSDTYTLTMHSEAVALAHAANHGETNILAITGPNCHICKQLIYESSLRSGLDTLIILEDNNEIKQIPISQLMPYPWPEEIK